MRGLVIEFQIRRLFLTLSYAEFAETRDVFDCVGAVSVAVALRWGKRSSRLASTKPVSRKTKLPSCF